MLDFVLFQVHWICQSKEEAILQMTNYSKNTSKVVVIGYSFYFQQSTLIRRVLYRSRYSIIRSRTNSMVTSL